MFFMGNTLTTLVQAVQEMQGRLTPMQELTNNALTISMLGQPDDHYLFFGMSRKEYQAVFNVAKFLNQQASGLTVSKLDGDSKMRRLFKPVAVYDTDDEFIAIAEGIEIPLYIFTYQVELVQFYFEDPSAALDDFVLDHSLIARKHAQTVAGLMADETRLSSHQFDDLEEVFENLIRHQREVRLKYTNGEEGETTTPAGMLEHDVYILQ